MNKPKPATGMNVGRLILTAVLTIGLVALLLTQVSIEKIVNMIKGADPGLFVLATLAYALSYVGRTWRCS